MSRPAPKPITPESEQAAMIREAYSLLTPERLRVIRAQCGFADKTVECVLRQTPQRRAKWLELATAA